MAQIERMRGAKFNKNGVGEERCRVVELPKPLISRPDEVLIRIEAVSICGTDVRALQVPPLFDFADGIVVGHEGCGIVEAVGAGVTNCKVGDKVVVHPNIWCGKCDPCRTGHINLCENFLHIGDRIDGAMAEYLCIEERMVYVIDSAVPSYVAALTEPLACVLNGTTTVKAHPGYDVAVLGGGPIGLIFTMIYKAMGAKVLVSEPIEYRRNLALELGADVVVNPETQDVDTEIRKHAPLGADIVVDAFGTLLPTAIQIAKKGANILCFGVDQVATVNIPQYPIIEKELSIHGTYITKGTFPLAIKIIENKSIPLDKLVTHRFPLEKLLDGINLMAARQAGKVVVEI